MVCKFGIAFDLASRGAICSMLVLERGREGCVGGSGVWMEGMGTVDAGCGLVCLVASVGGGLCSYQSNVIM